MAAEEFRARRFVIATSGDAYDVLIEKISMQDFRIIVPDLPGCASHAESFDAALARARETIERGIHDLRAAGQPVPRPGAAP